MVSTISLSEETKRKIRNLGHAGESYEDVIKRMYEVASRHILLHYLYDTSDAIPIDEAIADARRRWPKSS